MRACLGWILRYVVRAPYEDAMLGDLEEERALRSARMFWYWSQIVRSIPALLFASIRQDGTIATFAVAFGACVAQAAVEIATKLTVSSAVAVDARVVTILSLAVTLPMLVAVSYFAARIRRGAAVAFAALIVVSVGIQLMVKTGDGMPLWNQVAALFVGPSAALIGGVVAEYRRKRISGL